MARRKPVAYDLLTPQEQPYTGGSVPRRLGLDLTKPENWYIPVGVQTKEFGVDEIVRERARRKIFGTDILAGALGHSLSRGRIGLFYADIDMDTKMTTEDPMFVAYREDSRTGGIIIVEDLTKRFIDAHIRAGGTLEELHLRNRGQGPEGQGTRGPERG